MAARQELSELDHALIEAAGRGDTDGAHARLGQGASVEAVDESGRTVLIAAAYRNHLEVARLLVGAGADVNVEDYTRQSAYLIATSEGYVELLHLTPGAGADVHSTDSYNGTGLIRAADRGHVEVIRALLQTAIPIDHVNRLGWTTLLEAIIPGDGGPRHTEVVQLLVDAGANVNLADGSGVTPPAHAYRRGFAELVRVLEAAGAHKPGWLKPSTVAPLSRGGAPRTLTTVCCQPTALLTREVSDLGQLVVRAPTAEESDRHSQLILVLTNLFL